jgi:hypothetical protein
MLRTETECDAVLAAAPRFPNRPMSPDDRLLSNRFQGRALRLAGTEPAELIQADQHGAVRQVVEHSRVSPLPPFCTVHSVEVPFSAQRVRNLSRVSDRGRFCRRRGSLRSGSVLTPWHANELAANRARGSILPGPLLAAQRSASAAHRDEASP